ncbi:MAG TPA: MlaD family protein [Gemmatimonadales bacterium]|jgi:phospholipid/cholesterol/gamma-HCH transport system substrate-binding protein
MDLHKREVTVGSLVILAIVLFVVGTSWLSGKSITADEDDFWKIQFQTAGNLKASSVVRISGVPVGKVERVRLVDVGKVLVMVTLPDNIVPRVDATAQIVAVGFVGDAAIEINPGKAPQRLTRDRVIIGSQAAGLTDLAQSLGDRADSVLLGAQQIVNKRTADELYATLTALQGTLKAAERTMRVFGNPDQGPTAQLTKTLGTLEQLSTRLDSTLANPALARTLNRTDTLTGNLASMTAQLTSTGARLDTLLLNMNQGRGTLGKFTTDTGFYTDIRQLSQSMKELLDELKKHPGKIPVTVKLF